MPIDSKRLPVPESSFPFSIFADSRCSLLSDTSSRAGGCLPTHIQPLFSSIGVISQARGSAYLEIDKTKVIAAVYGPREFKFKDDFSLLGQVSCELKFATFSSKLRHQHLQGSEEKEASTILKEALEPAIQLDKYPKVRIDVFVIILEHDGSVLSAAISAASLALADGGIEMYDAVIGASLSQFDHQIFLDPDAREQYEFQKTIDGENSACVTIGYMPVKNQVSNVAQQGALDVQTVKKCIQLCIESCQKSYPVLQHCLVSGVQCRTEESVDQLFISSRSTDDGVET